ncbi:MAG TPA: alpha-amylase family glycosyl hydrolase [Candidatus Eisenbacteria bacterium]|nr:alpha-amylase family glycosyl hydrolase [Candidatus Eisenbacteria bacterium]
MNHPFLYEINTRCWLNELSQNQNRPVTLANIPKDQFAGWQKLGITHLWLMGVWTTGLHSRKDALRNAGLRQRCAESLPDCRDQDIVGSPYAVAQYQVSRTLGGETGLNIFRDQLHAHGLKLLLDFVPNHVGLDHAWVEARPELFVSSPTEVNETLLRQTARGPRWLAYGKDPFFHAWTDTAQLDYRNPATHAAMTEQLQSVSRRCDGVRCDMAMLVLKDVFAKNWERFPAPDAPAETEFWADAIRSVKTSQPDFLFLAEVYWDLEARLQELGFDYTYDKRWYDYLIARNYAEAQRHLHSLTPQFLNASAHFLENHDERRIASLLSWDEHRAALLAMASLPGMRILHEGQLSGARKYVPVQLGRRPVEAPQSEIVIHYENLLTTLQSSAIGCGRGELLRPNRAWSDNPTDQNFLLVQWQDQEPSFDLVVVNFAPHAGQCYAPLTIAGLENHNWQLVNRFGAERYERNGDDLKRQGLYLDVPAHGAQLFHFQPIL